MLPNFHIFLCSICFIIFFSIANTSEMRTKSNECEKNKWRTKQNLILHSTCTMLRNICHFNLYTNEPLGKLSYNYTMRCFTSNKNSLTFSFQQTKVCCVRLMCTYTQRNKVATSIAQQRKVRNTINDCRAVKSS